MVILKASDSEDPRHCISRTNQGSRSGVVAAPDMSIFDETTRTLSPIPNRTCPLCKSKIRLFFINFNDKMLMCENTECEFPFGYEDLQFVKENHLQHCDMELDTESIKRMSTTAVSAITQGTSGSEIEKINKVCLSEESQSFDTQAVDVQDFINIHPVKKPIAIHQGQNAIQNDLSVIKECTAKLLRNNALESNSFIKSEEKLLKLAALQEKSGSNVLTPLEMSILRAKGITFGDKKEECVKIDIKQEGDNIFQIDLEILDDGE